MTAKENSNYGTRTERLAKTQSKSVVQYTKDGEFVKVWQSVSEAERQLGLYNDGIGAAARGAQKTCCGFVWKYTENDA